MMKIFKKRLNKKGFTLVELLIVIAVLGIIAGIGVSTMGGVTDTFKTKADTETVNVVARQAEILILSGIITADITAADSGDATITKHFSNLPDKLQSSSDGSYTIGITDVGEDTATVTVTPKGKDAITKTIVGKKVD